MIRFVATIIGWLAYYTAIAFGFLVLLDYYPMSVSITVALGLVVASFVAEVVRTPL